MKKLFSLILSLVLIFSFCSVNAMAKNDTEVSISEGFNFAELKGNAIRNESGELKQGLRFKYSVDSAAYDSYIADGYSVEEIGVLAIRTSHLEGAPLVKDGRYNYNKANVGVIYNATDNINCLSQDNLASVVLINIGYNVKTSDFDFSAYAEDYTARMYVILNKDDEQKILYDTEDTACVVDVMKAIIDAYDADSSNATEQLVADYESVQKILESTVKDKNGKTVKQIYEGKYPSQSTSPTKPLAPTLLSKTDTTVTLTQVSGYEYKLGDGEWQTSNVFTGLSPATQYNFYQRVAETDSASASESSDALVVTTDKSTPAKPLAPTLASKTDTTVTLTQVSGYEYKLGDGEWQTSNVFTGLSPATQYNFYQRVAETDSANASESSDALPVTTEKTTTPPSSSDDGWTGDYIINTKPR